MSAYGEIKALNSNLTLPTTMWQNNSTNNPAYVTIHHLTLLTARELTGLLDHLNAIFAKEIEDGMTYPQEGEMGKETFEAYFFAAAVFIAISMGEVPHDAQSQGAEIDISIEQARSGRTWNECVTGYYYVKPNYPGRSSHICNAGFVVPPKHRGSGYGSLLAESYVFNAPKLGYSASVFNLVYVNNAASVKLWEKLNFTKIGRIPLAGRLRRKDGNGEEYVDAWIFYKKFFEE